MVKPGEAFDMTPEVREAVAALAADPKFNPDDYREHGRSLLFASGLHMRCKACYVKHAPDRVCGYCRMRVKIIRGDAPLLARVKQPLFRIYKTPEIPEGES